MSQCYPFRRDRTGFALAELIVAATLLLAGLAIVTQGTVQTKRLMQDTRQYNLAIDELSNQLERLTAMASPERAEAISDLQPSEEIRSILVDVSLRAVEIHDDDGNRISMSIEWDRGGPTAPLTLVGWVVPDAAAMDTKVAYQTKKAGFVEMKFSRRQQAPKSFSSSPQLSGEKRPYRIPVNDKNEGHGSERLLPSQTPQVARDPSVTPQERRPPERYQRSVALLPRLPRFDSKSFENTEEGPK